ncbi:MAG: phosphoglucomutase [Nitrospira bacterium SG8_35_1]|nr:MAG: phosphoglucomutase [Nitrospira bacterium SG8_35_1]
MGFSEEVKILSKKYISAGDHGSSDYFALIKELVSWRNRHEKGSAEFAVWQEEIDRIYGFIGDELISNDARPITPVKFGTSGWRGIIGKDLYVKSVQQVTQAIVAVFQGIEGYPELAKALGVETFSAAQTRGCVVGFDNRFGGGILAQAVIDVLTDSGIRVHYAGESTTGVLSAALLELDAAFSVNLTPSHNPLEYGGYKFNGSDGGPAASLITDLITQKARQIIDEDPPITVSKDRELVREFDSLESWVGMVRRNRKFHSLDYDAIISNFASDPEVVLAVDCVHGASRLHIKKLINGGFSGPSHDRLIILRGETDPTFGGVAPEPSSANMKPVINALAVRPESLKLGAVIDPDGDRIRMTDGTVEIDMNLFGGMAYHFLHEIKGLSGMVAKTVATSNFANQLAEDFGEDVFESKVGFKEFKPVIGKALVYFEESDGISVIGHTPEKDAYIGLLLGLDMVMTLRKNLGEYLLEIQKKHGFYYPAKDGVIVSCQGKQLLTILSGLEQYTPGSVIRVGDEDRKIAKVIDIDGRKMVLDDGSWLMIRPSGTEPKVRFYVEAREKKKQIALFAAAKAMLDEIGLLN